MDATIMKPSPPERPAYRRARRFLIGTLLVYALLVSTHLGEFWPFSIYPMFSQAGKPWTRAIVREVPEEAPLSWEAVALEDLPGTPYPLRLTSINQNDLANFVSKSESWDPRRVEAMRKIFREDVNHKRLLILQAVGRINDSDEVEMVFTPFLLMTPDTTYLHASLSSD